MSASTRIPRPRKRVVRLDVYYQDDGPRELVGRLGEDARGTIYFQYDAAWVATGRELSPHQLPLALAGGVVRAPDPRSLHGLHGLFADSLPDSWGLRVMGRALRRAGFDPLQIGALDRLAYLGTRTMGALTYHPATPWPRHAAGKITLDQLAAEADLLVDRTPDDAPAADALDALERVAGSAGGAQPKVLIAATADGTTVRAGTEPHPGMVPYLLKFTPRQPGLGLRPDSGSIEQAYAAMARGVGIQMGATRLFATTDGRLHFAAVRFDRTPGGGRRHVHSLGGLIGREPGIGGDYDELLRVARALTGDARVLDEILLRLAFNVAVLNDDDHVKNIAFRFDRGSGWQLAPAYDLTYAPSRRGERGMSVAGHEADVTWAVIASLAEQHSIPSARVNEIRASIEAVLDQWPAHAAEAQVPDATISELAASFAARRAQLARV